MLVFPDAKTFIKIVKAFNKITDYMPMSLKEDGIIMRAMDYAHVSMVSVSIPKEALEVYEADEIPDFEIDTRRITKILKGDGRLIMAVDVEKYPEDEAEYGMFYLFGGEGEYPFIKSSVKGGTITIESGRLRRSIKINFGSNVEIPPEPTKVELDTYAVVITRDLKEAVKELREFEETVELSLDGEDLVLKVEDSDNNEVEYRIMTLARGGESKCKYGLNYLNDFLSVAPTDSIRIEWGEKVPLRITSTLEMNRVPIRMRYWQAPRVE